MSTNFWRAVNPEYEKKNSLNKKITEKVGEKIIIMIKKIIIINN